MGGCLIVVGILLSLTGIGAIIGIPMILIAGITMWLDATSNSLKQTSDILDTATKKMQAENAKYAVLKNSLKGNCPYCDYENICPPATPGLDCPACNQRIIVRNNSFQTLDDTKDPTVVRPQLLPAYPKLTDEERKAARDQNHKQQWKVLAFIFYIIIGVFDLMLCLVDLFVQPLFSLIIFLLIFISPIVIWKRRKQISQRRYPIGIVLSGLFGASLLLFILDQLH
jgi:hypothetical protein